MKKSTYFYLYFSEGAPIGFIWWALPALLEKLGFSVAQTASISAIAVLPWTFKFFFAPFIDIVSQKWVSLKKQLIFYQALMGLSFAWLPQVISDSSVVGIVVCLLLHGTFAAMQDICIDSLAIKTIPKNELGHVNGIMQAGMLVGRSLFGGAGLFIALKFGLPSLVYFLISCIWVSIIILFRSKVKEIKKPDLDPKQYLKEFISLTKRKTFWLLIGLTYFAGFSYNGISTIGSALLSNLGASNVLHAISYSLLFPIAMTIGAVFGGKLIDKFSPLKVLPAVLFASILGSLMVAFFADFFIGLEVLLFCFFIFYFSIGASTSSLYGFLMKNTMPKFAALEYSVFMGVVNLCDSSTSFLTGSLVENYNYFQSTLIVGSITSLSFIFLFHLRSTKQKI